MLLFAVHESVQESMGFSPFEIVFDHAVRGPLLLLKDKWLDEDPEKISVLQYVGAFKDRLFRTGQMSKKVPKQNESMVRQKKKVKVF